MTPDKKARIYFVSAIMGAIATLGLAATSIFGWPDFALGLFTGIILVSLAMILRRKLRDEYTQGLWQAGTSAAFIAVVILAIFGPVLLGFGYGLIDGFNDTANAAPPDFNGKYVGIGAILAFYAGFHIAWLRSAR